METETGMLGQKRLCFPVVCFRKGFECQSLLPFVFPKGYSVSNR